jgi:hypothetical protein
MKTTIDYSEKTNRKCNEDFLSFVKKFEREAISDARFSVLAFEMSAMKAEHNLDMDWIFKLLCDADDALSILDTNPDALKVAHKRIKSAMKYAQEKGNIK